MINYLAGKISQLEVELGVALAQLKILKSTLDGGEENNSPPSTSSPGKECLSNED